MHHLVASVPVRKIEGDHLDTGKGIGERRYGRRIRSVADPDEKRALVEPDRVPTLGEHRLVESCRNGNVGVGERGRDRARLAAPSFLPGPQQHRPRRTDQHRVVDVDRVRIAGVVPRDDDLGAGRFEKSRTAARALRLPQRGRARHASRMRASARHPRRAEDARARARGVPSWTASRSESSQDATPRSSACVPRAAPHAARRPRAFPSQAASRASRSRCAA